MEAKRCFSERGNNLLIVEDCTFYKKRTLKNGEIVWSCTNRKCAAKVYTSEDGVTILRYDSQHCHEKDALKVNRKVVSNAAKRKADKDILERPSKILHAVMKENTAALENVSVKDVECIRKNIYNSRRKNQPVLPQNRNDAVEKLQNMSIRTLKDENFLLHADPNTGIVIFSCNSNLLFLSQCSKVFMDGTFKYCTKFWLQLFTIHAICNGHYVPLVFCLLPDKEKTTYATLFRAIVEKCAEINISFKPEIFVLDFEKAIHNAVLNIWPNARITGCKFHLGQAWYRKIQKLGLSREFQNKESDIGKWLKHIFGLSYLRPEDVGSCIAFDFSENQPSDPKVTEFVDYLIDNYVDEESKFPPHIWAEADASTENTTNACESFHSHFNSHFYYTHPNLNVFLQILQQCQTLSYVKMSSSNEDKKIYSKAAKQRQRDLEEMIEKYLNGNIPSSSLAKFACHKFQPVEI